MKSLEQKIEALLFYRNEPTSYTWLAKVLDFSKNEIREMVFKMAEYYENRGIIMVMTEDSVSLMTSESSSELISSLTKSDKQKELSKQALETLSIILYKEKITKAEIDYIRGVNSVFILRNLLIRGLITKKINVLDKRSPLYIPTHDILSHLGINSSKLLPDFEKIKSKLFELENNFTDEKKEDESEHLVVGDHIEDEE